MKKEINKTSNGLSGIYHIIFEVESEFAIKIGAAGEYFFIKGFYVYTGTAQRALLARLERHIKKDKKVRWHIDYLSSHSAVSFRAAYYYEGEPAGNECRRNRKIINNADFYMPHFGSSDCRLCPSHLAGYFDYSRIIKSFEESCVEYRSNGSLRPCK